MGIEYDKSLPACPVCGKKAFISHDMPDGYGMGWSVGCAAYRLGDGVHGRKMAWHGLPDRISCVEKWRKVCKGGAKNEK